MTALYLMIVFVPVAPAAMKSRSLAHALTGECSGDCSICGCSPESRAAQTCCCAKKKLLEHAHEDDSDTPECCRKKQASITVVRCDCPCGERSPLALAGMGSFEVMPFHFSDDVVLSYDETPFSTRPDRLTSRYGEPPDQPPKLSGLS